MRAALRGARCPALPGSLARSSFLLFGGAGILLGLILWGLLDEPARGLSDPASTFSKPAPPDDRLDSASQGTKGGIVAGLLEVLGNPMVLLLILVFIGANFVAVVFLTWMPTFLYQKFHMSLAMAGLNATAYLQIASVLGVFSGGLLADSLIKKIYGGRLLTQSFGLLCGVPFLSYRIHHVRAVPDSCHGRVRLLQGALRRQHLCGSLRCGAGCAASEELPPVF